MSRQSPFESPLSTPISFASSQRAKIPPFEVMEAFREAELLQMQGKDIVHLSLGQPSKPAPLPVREAVANALQNTPEVLGYSNAQGIPALRERIAQHYAQQYGLDIDPARVFVTVGSSGAYFLSLLAAFDVGGSLGIATPCYPAYPRMMEALGLEPKHITTTAETRFQPTWEQIAEVHARTPLDGMVIASPSNPTGTVLREAELKRIAEGCHAEGIRLISDEIYHNVTYENVTTQTALAFSSSAMVMNSFSKYFLLPGWRLGWAVVPENVQRDYESLIQNFFISPPAPSQLAAMAVFDCLDELDAEVTRYRQNRDILSAGLKEAGFTHLTTAEGAFYLYADVRDLTDDSKQFCQDMLHEAGVCAVPGNDFDPTHGHLFVRFSFSGSKADIQDACVRLNEWMQK